LGIADKWSSEECPRGIPDGSACSPCGTLTFLAFYIVEWMCWGFSLVKC
jgi:hypothetical protein